TRSGTAPYHGKLSGSTRGGWRIMMAVLLLGGGGIGFYVCWLNASFFKDCGEQLRALPFTLHGTLNGWVEDPSAAISHLKLYPKTTGHGQSTGSIEEAG